MATSNKDNTLEYDRQMYKKTKNHLTGRVNKFQEKVNQAQAPSPPIMNSVHK